MIPETFTATIRFPLTPIETDEVMGVIYLVECPELDNNRLLVSAMTIRVEMWLKERDKWGHHFNTYDNSCHISGRGEIAVVLDDRDTALMLKLALS